jgi:N-acetylglutamate synthase-like GNAT family acetyltransferase
VQISYQEKPGEGNTFLLLELVTEKVKSGASKFEWEKVYALDSPNDTFLESFNFGRIKSTDLTFEKNERFICFEISRQSAKGKLYLVYNSSEGENHIQLN